MPCYSPLEGYKDIITGGLTFKKIGTAQTLTVACGQCLGCRIDKRIMWAIRIVHESHMHLDDQGNTWLTLTYRDPIECTPKQLALGHYIPKNYSLRPDDVRKFFKNLRRKNSHKIRYFYCGEYGEENQRPHYHVCLFNHTFRDQQLFTDNEGHNTYTSPTLERFWPYGFATCAELNYQTAAYTAGYIFSKVTGTRADDHYLRCDEDGEAYWLLPEYILMSTGRKKPSGIGAAFYEKYKDDIFPDDTSPVPGHGTVQLVPRYYKNILEGEDPATLALVKNLRQDFIKEHKGDFTPARLRAKYDCARAKQSKLKRNI